MAAPDPPICTTGESSSSASALTRSAPTTAITATATAPARPLTLQLRRTSSGASPGGGLIRRTTTHERIDDILELGHQRFNSMSPGQSPPTFPRNPFPGRGGSMPTAGEEIDGYDEEPNERTGIVNGPAYGSPPVMNYQSTVESTGPRTRKKGAVRNGIGKGKGKGNGNGNGNAEDRSRDHQLNGLVNGAGQDGNGGENGDAHQKETNEKSSWLKTMLSKFGSIELENKGSVARDHLALERTFLAWLRTSLSFASIGVGITQLFRLNTSLTDDPDRANQYTLRHLGKPLGAIFLGISILMLFLGYHRYFQAQQWIIKGKFPASRGTIILVSLVALGLMVVSLVVVVVAQPASSK